MELPAQLADNLAFMIHRTALDYEIYFDNEMQALGLTRSQWLLLSHLYFCEGINQKELGELMGIGKGAIGRLAYKLELSGWIEREADREDRRAFRLYVRDKAKPLVRKLVEMLILETERSVEGVPAEEVEAVRRFLRRISGNIGDASSKPRWRLLKKQLLTEVRQLKR